MNRWNWIAAAGFAWSLLLSAVAGAQSQPGPGIANETAAAQTLVQGVWEGIYFHTETPQGHRSIRLSVEFPGALAATAGPETALRQKLSQTYGIPVDDPRLDALIEEHLAKFPADRPSVAPASTEDPKAAIISQGALPVIAQVETGPVYERTHAPGSTWQTPPITSAKFSGEFDPDTGALLLKAGTWLRPPAGTEPNAPCEATWTLVRDKAENTLGGFVRLHTHGSSRETWALPCTLRRVETAFLGKLRPNIQEIQEPITEREALAAGHWPGPVAQALFLASAEDMGLTREQIIDRVNDYPGNPRFEWRLNAARRGSPAWVNTDSLLAWLGALKAEYPDRNFADPRTMREFAHQGGVGLFSQSHFKKSFGRTASSVDMFELWYLYERMKRLDFYGRQANAPSDVRSLVSSMEVRILAEELFSGSSPFASGFCLETLNRWMIEQSQQLATLEANPRSLRQVNRVQRLVEQFGEFMLPSTLQVMTVNVNKARLRIAGPSMQAALAEAIAEPRPDLRLQALLAWREDNERSFGIIDPTLKGELLRQWFTPTNQLMEKQSAKNTKEINEFPDTLAGAQDAVSWYDANRVQLNVDLDVARKNKDEFVKLREKQLSGAVVEVKKLLAMETEPDRVDSVVSKILAVPGDHESGGGRKIVEAAQARKAEIEVEMARAFFSPNERVALAAGEQTLDLTKYGGGIDGEDVKVAILRALAANGGKRETPAATRYTSAGMQHQGSSYLLTLDKVMVTDSRPLGPNHYQVTFTLQGSCDRGAGAVGAAEPVPPAAAQSGAMPTTGYFGGASTDNTSVAQRTLGAGGIEGFIASLSGTETLTHQFTLTAEGWTCPSLASQLD